MISLASFLPFSISTIIITWESLHFYMYHASYAGRVIYTVIVDS